MKDGLNFCVAYMISESHTVASTDCLFVCLQHQRVHIVFSRREFTHVTWSRVPEPLLSAILGFYKLYYISPTAGCVVSAGCAGALWTALKQFNLRCGFVPHDGERCHRTLASQ